MAECEHNYVLVDAWHEAVGNYSYWSCTKCFAQQDYIPIIESWAKRMVEKYGRTKTNVGPGD